MRVLLQRVRRGAVSVAGEQIAEIGHGVVLLVGITHTDEELHADWLAKKIAGLRIFEDEMGKMNRSLLDVGGEALVVSQFTLYGDARKGRRPSFTKAARPEQAEPLVAYFVEALRREGVPVKMGQFGAHMLVEIENDGPVTLLIERE